MKCGMKNEIRNKKWNKDYEIIIIAFTPIEVRFNIYFEKYKAKHSTH